MIETYFEEVKRGLDNIQSIEVERMALASEKIANAIEKNGIIHIFGCGHSHMLAEEAFYRAGGLAAINPILIEPLMLHEGAVKSSKLEKTNDYAREFIEKQNISQHDVMIVVSTSGRNPVPIDVALAAKEKGCFVLGISSLAYTHFTSRHKNGLYLSDVVDLVINNHVEVGDAVLKHEKVDIPFSPVSTIYNTTILNAIFAQAIAEIADHGGTPPIFLSGNIDNAEQHNIKQVDLYQSRIPLLVENLNVSVD